MIRYCATAVLIVVLMLVIAMVIIVFRPDFAVHDRATATNDRITSRDDGAVPLFFSIIRED